MEWRYDPTRSAFALCDKDSVVAKICIKEIAPKPDRKNKYAVRTLISFIYCGNKTLTRLEKLGKEWQSRRRKFATKEELDEYVARQKEAVIERIAACEKGNLL